MRKVRVKTSLSTCRICSDMAQSNNEIPNCDGCECGTGIWIDTVNGFWGTYAIIQRENGKVEKIPLDRIIVISEESTDSEISPKIKRDSVMEKIDKADVSCETNVYVKFDKDETHGTLTVGEKSYEVYMGDMRVGGVVSCRVGEVRKKHLFTLVEV